MTVSDPLYLGLDLSTQQLKAVLVTKAGAVAHEAAVHFDSDLPQHKTSGGAHRGPNGRVTAPVAMWVDALDAVMAKLKASDAPFDRIAAVSGSGQQHGSVWWSHQGETLLAQLDAGRSLAEQLVPHAFSRPDAPIWMDSSTISACKTLTEAAGGAQALADLTGSRAYERFTGPQILKVYKEEPESYEATAHISLVSSFAASLFLGAFAPIEVGDASGMNLMDIATYKWNDKLLDICGGSALRSKLGDEPVLGGVSLGTVSKWWVDRWGFSPDCVVAPWTGDNPASVIAVSTPGDAILSLGTSTTFLLSTPPADKPPLRTTTSHLLAHPLERRARIVMLCYKNGALAREAVRGPSRSWAEFDADVAKSEPGNGGVFGFYFPEVEIIPPLVHGEFFFRGDGEEVKREDLDEHVHARAILESQLLSIKARLLAILPAHEEAADSHHHAVHHELDSPLRRLILVGGGSVNPTIQQLAADIFGMDVYIAETKEGAAVGGAVLAMQATGVSGVEPGGLKLVKKPRSDITDIYSDIVDTYRLCEQKVVDKFTDKS
ncbi:actin-like ATPase domain-containing protein [Exidia glandulosa HHB12029]|uniref:Xylulose kinase n=1 Tax=Exidia glandulosa HHB12029 TaxID=1314781 RepID=A0A165HHN7_EXIGL|nr:actin-like ATPase domain-containing protein [Exidia glandulosa HHB12029]